MRLYSPCNEGARYKKIKQQGSFESKFFGTSCYKCYKDIGRRQNLQMN